MWKDGLISTRTLYTKFPDLDLNTEIRNLETEKGTVLDSESRSLPTFSKSLGGAPPPMSESRTFVEEKNESSGPIEPSAPINPENSLIK